MSMADIISSIREKKDERSSIVGLMLESLPRRTVKPSPGPTDWLGMSRLSNICPKALVMGYRGKIELLDEIDAKSRWRMDRGTGLHVVVQELWLGPTGFLLGGWQCTRCAHIHGTEKAPDRDGSIVDTVTVKSAVPVPEVCEKCQRKNGKWTRFHFVEPEVREQELLLSGKTDGFLHMAPNPMEVLDIKTVEDLDKAYTRRDGTYVPSVREKPRAEHVNQVQWYMSETNLRHARLLYMTVGAPSAAEAMVEHSVPYDPAYMHKEREKIRGLREALKDETRPIPPCPYGGAGPYGECPCVEMAVIWADSRRRSLAEEHGAGGDRRDGDLHAEPDAPLRPDEGEKV